MDQKAGWMDGPVLSQKKNGGRVCTDASGPRPPDLVALAHGMFWGKGGLSLACISRNPSPMSGFPLVRMVPGGSSRRTLAQELLFSTWAGDWLAHNAFGRGEGDQDAQDAEASCLADCRTTHRRQHSQGSGAWLTWLHHRCEA
jgi:hypothetical protein